MSQHRTIYVCRGTGCVSGGGDSVFEALRAEVLSQVVENVDVDFTGCHGFCQRGPLVVIEPESTCYVGVATKDVDEIVESHLKNSQPVERLLYKDIETGDPINKHQDIPFYAKQHKIVLKGCGRINPEKIEDYIRVGGYEGLKKVLEELECPVIEVKGGETLDLGGSEWEVISTPGHTMDGISLYHVPTKTAFTGDTVLPYGMSDPDNSAGGRLDHYLFSVKELLKRDIENILPGHGVPVVSAGKRVVEVAYESVIAKVLEIEGNISWMDIAPQLVQKGLLEEAVYCSDKELNRNPDNLTALQLKAYCLTDMGKCEASLEILDKILAKEGDNSHALLGKGHALMGLGKHDESLKYFDDVIKINPDIKEAHIYKGMALTFLGKHEEAMEIEAFKTEFAERFKHEIDKQQQQKEQD